MYNNIDPSRMRVFHELYGKDIDPELSRRIEARISELYYEKKAEQKQDSASTRNNNIDPDRMRRNHELYGKDIDPELSRRIEERINEIYREEQDLRKEEEQKKLDKEVLDSIDADIVYAKIKNSIVAHNLKMEKQQRKVTIYKRVAVLALGGASVAIALSKSPMGGKMMNVMKSTMDHIVDRDNERLENQYQNTSDEIENLTGMSPNEIIERGKTIK